MVMCTLVLYVCLRLGRAGRYKHSTPHTHVHKLVYHTTSAINVCRVNSKKEVEVTKRVWDQLSRANICEAFKTFSPAYVYIYIYFVYLWATRTRRSSVMVGFDMGCMCIWRVYKVNWGLWIVSRWWRWLCSSRIHWWHIELPYRGKMCILLGEKRNANRPAGKVD